LIASLIARFFASSSKKFSFLSHSKQYDITFLYLFFLIPNKMISNFFIFSFSFQTKWFQISFSFLSHSKQNNVTFLFLFFLIPNKMMLRFFFFSFSFQTKWCYVSFSFLSHSKQNNVTFLFFSFSFQIKWCYFSFSFLSHSKQNDINFLFLFFLIPNKMISTFFLVHPREYQMTRLYETNPKKIYSSFFYFGSQKNKTFLFFSSFGILVFIIIETILRRWLSFFNFLFRNILNGQIFFFFLEEINYDWKQLSVKTIDI